MCLPSICVCRQYLSAVDLCLPSISVCRRFVSAVDICLPSICVCRQYLLSSVICFVVKMCFVSGSVSPSLSSCGMVGIGPRARYITFVRENEAAMDP
jgi:hypothetical protein